MPTRFDLWILSYDFAITALTPSRRVPLAAQSLLLPEPYWEPARTTSCVESAMYLSLASWIDTTSSVGKWVVKPPSVPGAVWFLILMFANVPLTMTS